VFREFVDRQGLPKTVHVHTLRHSAASFLAAAGVPASDIATQLGHKDGGPDRRGGAGVHPALLQRVRGSYAYRSAEADGNRTRQAGDAHLNGFEGRCLRSELVQCRLVDAATSSLSCANIYMVI
jgi:Phage integrase family